MVDNHRELMGNAVDAHLAIMSNRMNKVMKRMTSWGAILLGSTLVTGVYGMNFHHMPELTWHWGFWWALSVMAFITVAGYLWFRAKDWL
jgi:magnesium transporter